MQSSDLQFFRAKSNGRLSSNVIISGSRENLFPRITREQRQTGTSIIRKVFFKPAGTDNAALFGGRLWIDAPTATDDWQWWALAGQREATPPATPRRYTALSIPAVVPAGATTLTAELPVAAAGDCIQAGDEIVISSRADALQVSGAEEYATVLAATAIGTTVTIIIASGLLSGYPAGSRLSPVLATGDIIAGIGNVSVASAAGTFDAAQVVAGAIGAVEADITLTFVSPSAFTAVADDGDVILPAGTTAVDYMPVNPNFSSPFFTIPASAFAGTFAAGDSITFSLHPQAAPLWAGLEIPAGAQPGFANPMIVGDGDS